MKDEKVKDIFEKKTDKKMQEKFKNLCVTNSIKEKFKLFVEIKKSFNKEDLF